MLQKKNKKIITFKNQIRKAYAKLQRRKQKQRFLTFLPSFCAFLQTERILPATASSPRRLPAAAFFRAPLDKERSEFCKLINTPTTKDNVNILRAYVSEKYILARFPSVPPLYPAFQGDDLLLHVRYATLDLWYTTAYSVYPE